MTIRLHLGPMLLSLHDAEGETLPLPMEEDPHAGFLVLADEALTEASPVEIAVRRAPAPADVVDAANRGIPLARHRSGWLISTLARGGQAVLVAHLHIPPDGPEVERLLLISREGAELYLPPQSLRPEEPLAYLFSELAWLLHLHRVPGALLHACAVRIGSAGVILAGQSGSGKSTFAALWEKADVGTALADETVMLWREGASFRIGGTPWPGSAGVVHSGRADLSAVCLLAHGDANEFVRLDPAEAVADALSHTFLPSWDRGATTTVSSLLAEVGAHCPAWRYAFRPDESATSALLRKIEKTGVNH